MGPGSPTIPFSAAPGGEAVSRRVMALFGAFLGLVLAAIARQLYGLQVQGHETHQGAVRRAINSVQTVPGQRGSIVDRMGRPLALSVGVRSCALDPEYISRQRGARFEEILDRLADLLRLTPPEYQRIREAVERGREPAAEGAPSQAPLRFVWVRRKMDAGETGLLAQAMRDAREEADRWRRKAGALRAEAQRQPDAALARSLGREADRCAEEAARAAARFAGVILPREYARRYPQERVAAHLVGFTDVDGNGLEGIERFGNAYLAGQDRRVRVQRDANGRLLAVAEGGAGGEGEDRGEGRTLELALDSYLQMVGREELAKGLAKAGRLPGLSGCFVLLDPWTGDVLAMGGLPDFDPDRPADGDPLHRLNQAIAAVQEPGSVMKAFVYAQALEEGLIDWTERLDCSTYRQPTGGRGRRLVQDVSPYGTLTLAEALYKSSNVGAVKVAERLGPRALHGLLARAGFGQRATAGSGTPAAGGGPSPAVLYGELPGKVRPLAVWDGYSVSSIPQGYELSVTPLQMALAYCAFANGGWLPEPRLVRAVRDAGGARVEEVPPRMRRRLFREETALSVRGVLRQVVTQGTARRYANDPVYAIAGKTGTANLLATPEERRDGQAKGPYSTKRHRSNFVGMAPHENPRLVVMVSIYNTPKMGGEASAPVGAAILRRSLEYLHEPPSPR